MCLSSLFIYFHNKSYIFLLFISWINYNYSYNILTSNCVVKGKNVLDFYFVTGVVFFWPWWSPLLKKQNISFLAPAILLTYFETPPPHPKQTSLTIPLEYLNTVVKCERSPNIYYLFLFVHFLPKGRVNITLHILSLKHILVCYIKKKKNNFVTILYIYAMFFNVFSYPNKCKCQYVYYCSSFVRRLSEHENNVTNDSLLSS